MPAPFCTVPFHIVNVPLLLTEPVIVLAFKFIAIFFPPGISGDSVVLFTIVMFPLEPIALIAFPMLE